jgi:hypothetical protein
VALDPTYVKAMHKRAHAKKELGLLQVDRRLDNERWASILCFW